MTTFLIGFTNNFDNIKKIEEKIEENKKKYGTTFDSVKRTLKKYETSFDNIKENIENYDANIQKNVSTYKANIQNIAKLSKKVKESGDPDLKGMFVEKADEQIDDNERMIYMWKSNLQNEEIFEKWRKRVIPETEPSIARARIMVIIRSLEIQTKQLQHSINFVNESIKHDNADTKLAAQKNADESEV